MSGSNPTSTRERIASRFDVDLQKTVYLLPALLVMVGLFVVPLGQLLVQSFLEDGAFTLANFQEIFTSSHYRAVIFRTVRIAIVSTAIVLVLGYTLAHYVVFQAAHKRLLMLFLFVSMIVDLVVRIYGWILIFSVTGPLSMVLVALGVWPEPTSLLYTELAIIVGIVQFCLPLMALSLVGVLDGIDPTQFEAARNLGATRIEIFRHITFPLSIDGILAGGSLVFSLAMSTFVVPQLLGGARNRMIANSVYSVLQTSGDQSLAAALSVLLLAITLLLLLTFESRTATGGSG